MPHNRSIRDKLLKGGAWAFAGKVVAALTGLAVSALLARLLTPAEMGAYFLTLSLVTVAAIVAQLGLTQTIVRLVAESMGTGRSGRARKSVALVLRMLAISGLIVAAILAFGVGQRIATHLFNSEIMAQVMGLAAVWVVILSFQQLMAEVFRGFHDIRLATIFGGLSTSVMSMLLFVCLWLLQGHGNLDQVVALSVGAGFISIMISSALLWNTLGKIPLGESDISLSEILHISWPLWITNLTLFVLVQTDLWVVGLFLSSEEVAAYGAAKRLVAMVAMPLLIVNAVVPPLISEMYAQGKFQDLEKSLRAVATLAGLPALLVLGAFIFWGGELLQLIFGGFYLSGGIMLAILSVGQLANVWSGSCGQVLMLTGNQTTMMMITIVCGVVTVLLAWWLVEAYGGEGVAIAAASGMTLQNLLMLFYAKKMTGVWTHVNPFIIKNMRTLL